MMETSVTNGMCRCCASEGAFKDVKSSYHWMGQEEVYGDMLRECFDLSLSISEGEQGSICELCITQLRNAVNFKKQVLHTEEQFKTRLQNKLFKTSIVKVELSGDDDNDSGDNNMSGDDDYSGPDFEVPIKTESPDEPKSKKRAVKATTSSTKRTKTNVGETSTKREYELQNKLKTDENDQRNSSSIDGLNNITKQITTSVQNKTVQNQTNEPSDRTHGNAEKHQLNLHEILKNSNATLIGRNSSFGYGCEYCVNEYSKPAALKAHTLKEHRTHEVKFMRNSLYTLLLKLDITGLHCTLCNEKMETLDRLVEHLKNIHKKNVYPGEITQMFPFKFDSDTLQCFICKNTFNKFKKLLEHMNTHYRNYVCDVCDAGFVNCGKFKKHKATHDLGSFKCSNCPKVFDTILKKKLHIRSVHVHNHMLHKCHICNEKFSNYAYKEDHMAKLHDVFRAAIKCQACEQTYSNRAQLRIHTKRDHLLERPHKCLECEKTFFSMSSLKNHHLTHNGKRSFKCDVCLKSYSRKNTLREHMRIHDNDRRFKCEHCGQTFVQKCSWKGHMRSKHGNIV